MESPAETNDLRYRLAVDTDLHKVYDLYMDQSSNAYLTYDFMDKMEFEKIYNELLPTSTLYVVEMDDSVIASYRLIPKTDRQAHIVYLGGFVVDHSVQGRGIGSKILDHIKHQAAKEGKKRIELTVDINNDAALKLYKKTGFEIEGRIRHSYKINPGNRYLDEYLMGMIL
jgi:ribosomal protein S18 acetylase RimI-like enzyme